MMVSLTSILTFAVLFWLVFAVLFWLGTALVWFAYESQYARGRIWFRVWRAVIWLPYYLRDRIAE